jgi:hypothetical protein
MPKGPFDVPLNGFGGYPEPRGDLGMSQRLETVQEKCLSAPQRQLFERGNQTFEVFDSVSVGFRIGARTSGVSLSRLSREKPARRRFAAIGIRSEIGGGSEEHCPGLVPRRGVAAFAQIEPGVLKNILRLSATGPPRHKPQEIIADLQKTTRQSIRRIHVEIWTLIKNRAAVYHRPRRFRIRAEELSPGSGRSPAGEAKRSVNLRPQLSPARKGESARTPRSVRAQRFRLRAAASPTHRHPPFV